VKTTAPLVPSTVAELDLVLSGRVGLYAHPQIVGAVEGAIRGRRRADRGLPVEGARRGRLGHGAGHQEQAAQRHWHSPTAMTRWIRASSLVAALMVSACGQAHPLSPSPLLSAIIQGRVTDGIDGTPVPGARVMARDIDDSVTTDENDSFSLPLPDLDSVRVEVDATGYWPRTTRMAPHGSSPVGIDLLPDGKGFNLPFFDYVFR
jgi:Carboxypeptidase regulatory-like domain